MNIQNLGRRIVLACWRRGATSQNGYFEYHIKKPSRKYGTVRYFYVRNILVLNNHFTSGLEASALHGIEVNAGG
jgi:hypothetical protein